jgi:hypothetical protein
MLTVWKFPIPIEGRQVLSLPRESQLLSVQMQGGLPCLWALVDPDAPKEDRRFLWVGTGHPIQEPDTLRHVGTVQLAGGSLVFHLFELVPEPIKA